DRAASTMRLAVRDGHAEAKIILRPAELGEVRIHLHYGPGGVSALVTADSPQAAQALAQAAPELRRALEDQGVNVQQLDVGQSGADAERAPDRRSDGQEAPAQRVARVETDEEGDADADLIP